MALIDQPIPNLFGGVSQQTPLSRYLNQLEEMDNCLADPIEGLRKRPPTEHVARLFEEGDLDQGSAFFKIDRDPDNRFIASVSPDGTVKVFNILTGVEHPVTDNTNGYLVSANPQQDIKSLTVADYTYLVNRTVTVAKAPDVAPTRPYEGLIFVQAGNYGKEYKVTVRYKGGGDGIVAEATYSTPDGSQASHIDDIGTTTIAEDLRNQLALAGNASRTVEVKGSVIYFADTLYDFDIEISDDQGGLALKRLKDNIQRFSSLPEDDAKEGVVLRIAGDQTSSFDDYFVRYDGNVWEETLEPGLETTLDADTMPVALIRDPDNTFRLETLPWVDRKVGDDDSVPFPSFVGFPIRSMFYFRNRLGFLADENVILSQAGDYFNFFRTTATALLDGDPIDTPASDASGESSPVSILEHAVAFDKKLVIFSRNAQFILGSNGYLTPLEAEIDPVTSFAASPECRPVTAGRFVYFPFDRDGASGVREFYVDGAAQTEDAQEITSHCPTYLPSGIQSMSASTLENVIVARSSETPNKLYLYEYFWAGQEKRQSAWSQWIFSEEDEILFCEFLENVAYVVTKRPTGVFLERIRFRPNLTDDQLTYFTHLDQRVEKSQMMVSYDVINNKTLINLPMEASEGVELYTLKAPSGQHAPGVKVDIVNVLDEQLQVAGDITGWNFVAGVPYTSRFTLTRPYATQQAQNGTVSNTEAVVKVRDYSLDYAGTGYFTAVFSPKHREPYTKVFSGNILGASPTDIPEMDEGTFRMKTPTRNIYWSLSIENNSPFPSRFVAASWRGLMESKSQRV